MRIASISLLTGIQVLLAALTGASSLSITASSSPQKPNDASTPDFSYNRQAALDLKEESSKQRDGVRIRDISYAAYAKQGKRIKAYLVQPVGSRPPYAGVLFFHWLGEPNGDRNEFLEEAVELAKRGTVSVLIQGYVPWSEPFKDAVADHQRVIEQTIEVRRAIDLLLSQPGVDPKRIAYVGHDYGAMYGAIVAGVDKRVKAYVMVAGMGNFGDWSLKYWPATAAKGEAAYRQAMQDLDPQRYISSAAPAALLFQFANSDKYISKATAMAFYDAGSQPKQVKWYDAEHDLNVEAAPNDRRSWLASHLGLLESK